MNKKYRHLSPGFLERLSQVKNRRARIVIEHILREGHITTEELKELYGYNHPPRAAKDVRDEGIPLRTFKVKSSDGRTIAAYEFDDPAKLIEGRIGGRRAFSKKFKNALYEAAQGKCAICNGDFTIRELQIDHRVPYEIAGEPDYLERHLDDYMLLCGSCNRTKSWSCEHCPNWTLKQIETCKTCYWASPLSYQHIATRNIRRTELVWENDEIATLDALQNNATEARLSLSQYIKEVLRDFIRRSIRSLLSVLPYYR